MIKAQYVWSHYAWLARAGAINAILKDYKVLIEALEEIYDTTKDEYGLKA